jgi:carbamoylphosphate synthase large subunit
MNKNNTTNKINQIYIEIICNIIRKENIKLLEKIGEKEMLPIRELLNKYVITKTQVKNILTTLES